jgi:hypothetical protein
MMQTADSDTKLADSPSRPCILRLRLGGERKMETTPRVDFVENSRVQKP